MWGKPGAEAVAEGGQPVGFELRFDQPVAGSAHASCRCTANTQESAKSFIRYYVAVQNQAGQTGDTATLADLARPDCTQCVGIRQLIDSTYAAGGHIEGLGWTIKKITGIENAPGNLRFDYFDMRIREEAQRLYSSAGASPSVFDGNDKSFLQVGLKYQGGWKIASLIPEGD